MRKKLFFEKVLLSILLTFIFIACQKEENKEESIRTVSTVDIDNIAIHLSESDSSFIYYMKEAIVPDENKDHLNDTAIGTGPYKVAEYQREQKLVLSKNEEYWGEKAKIPTVSILISPNSETNFLKLLSGEINFLSGIDSKRIPELDKYQILNSPSNLCLILSLNPKEKPFDDIEVRKAINLAIDKNKIIQLAMNGKGSPIYTNMSPVMSKFLWAAPEEKADPQKAKQILEEKKLLPIKFTLKVPNSSKIYLDTAQSIKEQLKDVGITVDLEIIEWATWLSDVYTNRKYVASLAGLAGKMEPDAILRRYTSTYAKNFTNFNNARYDMLIEEAKRTSNEAKQVENYKEAQKILTEEQAAIFLMDPNTIIATEKGLEGFEFYPLPYLNFAKLYFKK